MNNTNISSQIPAIQDIIGSAQDIGIIVTDHYNLDKMAAGLALFLSLSQAGKNVQIISKKDPIVEVSNLVGINKVKKNFDGSAKTLVVSLPYREGEIEKVSYNIEGSRLNINLFAPKDKSINFQEKDVQYIRGGAAPQVLITIGIRSTGEMSGMVDDTKNVRIVAIDTSNANLNFAEVALGDGSFSSASEVVSALIEGLRLPIEQDIAQNIMDGVSLATNNFTQPNTNAYAFQAAAFALQNGAKRKSGSAQQQSQQQSQQQNQPQRQPRQQQNAQPVRLEQPDDNEQGFDGQVQEAPQEAQEQQNQDQQESVPSDWFMPKVFKSSRGQQDEE